jgi:hypothetical protein
MCRRPTGSRGAPSHTALRLQSRKVLTCSSAHKYEGGARDKRGIEQARTLIVSSLCRDSVRERQREACRLRGHFFRLRGHF